MTTGGQYFAITVEDSCSLDLNFYCEQNSLATNILYPPIMKLMTDDGNGTYTTTYNVELNGYATVDVFVLN